MMESHIEKEREGERERKSKLCNPSPRVWRCSHAIHVFAGNCVRVRVIVCVCVCVRGCMWNICLNEQPIL